jgi:NADH:ubiquinone oxidoreductase subunit 2 (subunit N)
MLPEITVAVGAMALLMYGVFRPETNGEGEFVGWLAILVLVVSLLRSRRHYLLHRQLQAALRRQQQAAFRR